MAQLLDRYEVDSIVEYLTGPIQWLEVLVYKLRSKIDKLVSNHEDLLDEINNDNRLVLIFEKELKKNFILFQFFIEEKIQEIEINAKDMEDVEIILRNVKIIEVLFQEIKNYNKKLKSKIDSFKQ